MRARKRMSLFAVVLCAVIVGCDGQQGNAAARAELERMMNVMIAAAASPKAEDVKAGVDAVAKEHGLATAVSELKRIAESDAKLRLPAVYALQFYMSESDFPSYAKRVLTDEEHQRLTSFKAGAVE